MKKELNLKLLNWIKILKTWIDDNDDDDDDELHSIWMMLIIKPYKIKTRWLFSVWGKFWIFVLFRLINFKSNWVKQNYILIEKKQAKEKIQNVCLVIF